MRFTEAQDRQLVSTTSARTIARIESLLVDAEASRVAGLRLKKVAGEGSTIAWEELHSFGRDVVTVDGDEGIQAGDPRLEELSHKDRQLLGKRVLEESGTELGVVEDVEFDPATGALTSILTSSHTIEGARLRGVGSYAVVVSRA